jgi:uridine phosphorylase
MWESGGMASTGIENMAELGSTGSLNSELSASADVGDVVIGMNAFNNQITTQTFSQLEMDSTNKYFSMVSMVAPR